MGSNGINILVAPAYPLAGAPAMCGKGSTSSLVSVDQPRPWTAGSVERALTNGQPAFVKVRKHVLLWSAQERST
ncbi:hypothetical protein [Kutzneria buriramensis]|uniref:Uncharacterized protein n=1 Tax=Kutzneria buriramensis TaxID=1045776 RepID=A0A3E0H096_9PSEU|nr:hypothetical protein [Kutzneria buriramensis]REH35837.1 hypothetical protein BCF44_117229 [Kutzneria buriramensis]